MRVVHVQWRTLHVVTQKIASVNLKVIIVMEPRINFTVKLMKSSRRVESYEQMTQKLLTDPGLAFLLLLLSRAFVSIP